MAVTATMVSNIALKVGIGAVVKMGIGTAIPALMGRRKKKVQIIFSQTI